MVAIDSGAGGLDEDWKKNRILGESRYEDGVPRGRETTYWLAAIIAYAAICGASPPTSFTLIDENHPLARRRIVRVVGEMRLSLVKFE